MSDDVTRASDDELGMMLGRAVEAQRVRVTPFDASRLAQRLDAPRRGFPWGAVVAMAALVASIGLAYQLVGGRGPNGVASSPTPTATATATSVPASATPTPSATVRERVYFTRDQLPPVAALVDTEQKGPSTAESRTRARLEALATAAPPSGAFNTFASLRTKPRIGAVRIEGDLVRIDYSMPTDGSGHGDWGVEGSAGTGALIQQLVYTASEETGIRRVLITANGRTPIEIGGHAVIDRPLTREDVLGYGAKTEERVASVGEAIATTLSTAHSVDNVAPGLASMRITLRPAGAAPQGGWMPAVTAELRANSDPSVAGKWVLSVSIPNGRDPQTGTQRVDTTPLRSITTESNANGTTYRLALDDARPWRISLAPGASPAMELHVDVGGPTYAVSDSVAVYGPVAGQAVAREFTVRGAARAFEATVNWRVRDSGGRVVADGFTTATNGTSAIWGLFETKAQVPANVSGNVTLEVFWASPMDGRDVGRVAIPLTLR